MYGWNKIKTDRNRFKIIELVFLMFNNAHGGLVTFNLKSVSKFLQLTRTITKMSEGQLRVTIELFLDHKNLQHEEMNYICLICVSLYYSQVTTQAAGASESYPSQFPSILSAIQVPTCGWVDHVKYNNFFLPTSGEIIWDEFLARLLRGLSFTSCHCWS